MLSTLVTLQAQDITFNTLYKRYTPQHYSIGSYPITGTDGLKIKWDGGIRLSTNVGIVLQV